MIGVLAAVAATVGDLLLLATSNAGRPGFEWLGPPYRRWVAALGVAGGVLGGTTHGLTGLVIHVEQSGGAGGLDPVMLLGRHGAYLLPLWAAIAMLSLAGSIAYATALLAGRSSLPRALAPVNPLVLTIAIALGAAGSSLGRAFLVPAAPNLAHVVFFGTVAMRHRRAR